MGVSGIDGRGVRCQMRGAMGVKRSWRIAVSLACGVAAALLAMAYAGSVRADAARVQQETVKRYGGDLVSVCVATRDIQPGETLDESNVAVEEWVASLLPDDAVTSLRSCVGKAAASKIPRRAVVCPAYFEAGGDAVEVPKGKVALSVPSDEEHSVGGAIRRGDEVEVYVSRDNLADCIARAHVLDTSSLAAEGQEMTWTTLAVDPADVQEVLSAVSAGTLTIVVPGEGAVPPEEGKAPQTPEAPNAPSSKPATGKEEQ